MIATIDGGTYVVHIDSEFPGLREIRCNLNIRGTFHNPVERCHFQCPRTYAKTAALLTEHHLFKEHGIVVRVVVDLPSDA